ncbi:MAG: polynucleotide adenylyltransferase PcnB [Gammaproteobacteria bacterium]|nr:polynucleotide adenylyltransferase PcnB [Gammaproteobacteria bacterium]MBU1655022.1 polynucleotide adenylyltransferase PcnB [Gammaproteobacteria bacterium]MBU1960328.1 polynucleotide adenylyltransferase PcnB [Gammaproteobacteria bacterium]
MGTPTIIARPDHNISRANISRGAVRVLYQLREAGFDAYLVGGGVRDLLLGREPKDFDVATNAHPDQVKDVFGRNCHLIGRRFRLAHVRAGRDIVEVATFRAIPRDDGGDHETDNGMILRDNVYGNIEEDALRRDFTVNALYYNIADFSVVDYGSGMADLRAGMLRLLGDPEVRFREDPVRMLRAVRFAAKLGFNIHRAAERLMPGMASLLREVPSARLFEECLKLFHGGQAVETFEKLRHYRLFDWLFPETERCLGEEEDHFPITFVVHGLANTDARILENKPVTPAFLFAVLLWEPVRRLAGFYVEREGLDETASLQRAGSEVLVRSLERVSIPKRYSLDMREIWQLQPRFEARSGKRPQRLLSHPRFRAAYDFMLLRAKAGEAEQELADWWTRFQASGEEEQRSMTQEPDGKGTSRKRRRRPRSTKKSAPVTE